MHAGAHRKLKSLILGSAILVAGQVCVHDAGALTTLDLGYGTSMDGESARSLGMGSVGVTLLTGSQALVQNPSLLALAEGRGFLDLQFWVVSASENRFQPLFDTFDSFVANTSIALNQTSYLDITGGIIYRLPVDTPMSIAVGIYDRWFFDYDYFEEIRDPNPFPADRPPRDKIVQLRKMEIDGRLRSASMGYGAQLFSLVNVGLSLHRYFGNLENNTVTNTTPQFEDIDESPPGSGRFNHDLAGWGWGLGLSGKVGERVDVGLSFEGQFSVKGAITEADTITQWVPWDTTTTVLVLDGSDVEVTYPSTLRFGFDFKPQTAPRATFVIEAIHRWWESVGEKDEYRVPAFVDVGKLRNTWDLRFGLEYIFYSKVPGRLGFRYVENYADPESSRSIYSAGLGWTAARWNLDLGLQYQRQDSRQDYLFERTLTIDGETWPEPASMSLVQDSIVVFVLGATWKF
jgi:hypothetical protein